MSQVVFRALLVIATLALPGSALAQSATLTVKDGRALVVGGETMLGEGLQSGTLGGEAIVSEFARLCLPDPANAGERAGTSPLGLVRADTIFPGENNRAEARIIRWTSSRAILTVWTGDETGLKGRPIAIPSRAYTTAGSYGPFKAFGTQCNLVLGVADFSAAQRVTDALLQRFGPAGKLVVKNTFADGYWNWNSLRINVNIPTTRGGTQPVHLSAQQVPTE